MRKRIEKSDFIIRCVLSLIWLSALSGLILSLTREIRVAHIITGLSFCFIFMLPYARINYAENYFRKRFSLSAIDKFAILVLAISFFQGYFNNSALKDYLNNISLFVCLFSFFDLGRYDSFWVKHGRYIFFLSTLGLFLSLAGLAVPATGVRYDYRYNDSVITQRENVYGGFSDSGFGDVGRLTGSVAYQLSPLTMPWILFLALYLYGKVRNRVGRILILLMAGAQPIFHLLFIKRMPSFIFLLQITLLCFVSPVLFGLKINMKKVFLGIILVLSLSFFCREQIPEYWSALISRYKTEDVSRFEEFRSLTTSLTPLNWVLGKGIGGRFPAPEWKASEHHYGDGMSKSIHIGYGGMLLFGGLTFILFYLFVFVRPLFFKRSVIWKDNPINIGAWVFMFSYAIQMTIESFPATGISVLSLMIGLCGSRLRKDIVLDDRGKF